MRAFARFLALIALLAAPAKAEDLVVFAAASLKTALDRIAEEAPAATGERVVLSYGGSSQLARQILLGAPADLYLSANSAWMDELEKADRIIPGTRHDLLGNRLVLIARRTGAPPVALDNPQALPARLGDGRLAMALVDAVPAGIYGKAALETLGIWENVEAQVAQADNVRAALALVATGAAPLGVVYASDAVAEPKVEVVATFPADSHPPIVYPVAAIVGHDGAGTRAFLDRLRSPAGRAVFEAQGFTWLGG